MSDATQTATATTQGSDTSGADTPASTATTAATQATTTNATQTTTEAAPAAAKPEGDKPAGDAKPDAKPEGAPESYAEFTLPEGITADAAMLDKFKATAKDLNLTQDGAQKVVSLYAEHHAAQFRQTVDGWQQQAKGDAEIGGEKFTENLAVAKKALEQFATPAFNAFLNQTGLGSHPEMIRAFYKAGKAISEDGFVPGRAGQSGKSLAQQMYPNMNP